MGVRVTLVTSRLSAPSTGLSLALVMVAVLCRLLSRRAALGVEVTVRVRVEGAELALLHAQLPSGRAQVLRVSTGPLLLVERPLLVPPLLVPAWKGKGSPPSCSALGGPLC